MLSHGCCSDTFEKDLIFVYRYLRNRPLVLITLHVIHFHGTPATLAHAHSPETFPVSPLCLLPECAPHLLPVEVETSSTITLLRAMRQSVLRVTLAAAPTY